MDRPDTTAGGGAAGLRVVGLDHVVLVVRDVEESLRWYCGVLGLEAERLEEWRGGTVPFPSVRLDATTIIDLLAGEPDGGDLDHLAVTVEGVELEDLAASGLFDVAGGPASLFGARGQGRGLYVRDPDGHVIELRTYG